MKTLIFIIALITVQTGFAQSEKRMAEIESRLETLEYRNFTRNFSLNGTLINHFEAYGGDVKDDGDGNSSHEQINAMGTLFWLGVNFDVSKNLKVYSRLGMSKFWNNESTNDNRDEYYRRNEYDDSWDASNAGSFGYEGSTPRFDRAYLSYAINDTGYTFAIGRMPTNFGPPSHYYDDLDRQGTYPRFGYNAIFDGAALVYSFKHILPESHKLSLRFFYTPFVFVGENSRTTERSEDPDGDSGPKPEVTAGSSLAPQYTFLADYETTVWSSFADKFLASYFIYNYSDFYQYVPGDDVYKYQATGQTLYLGFENILKTGISINWSHLYVSNKTASYTAGGANSLYSNADLYHINYKFQKGFLEGHLLGLEYIKTDENYYLDEFTYYSISDFYKAPNNKGFHYFYSLPVMDNSRLRLGAYIYDKQGSNSPDADQSEKDVQSYYVSLRTDF